MRTTRPRARNLRDTRAHRRVYLRDWNGGTLGGVSRYLKEQKPAVRIVLADPMAAALHHW